MVTEHSEVCDSDDIVPYAEEFEDADPTVNEGVFYCRECERELVTRRIGESEVFVF